MRTCRAIALLLLAALPGPAGCILIQSVPDDRGRAAAVPAARIILEQRQAPAPAPNLPPK